MKSNINFLLVLAGITAALICCLVSLKLLLIAIVGIVFVCTLVFDFHKTTYIMGAYVVIDYIARTYFAFTVFANSWDDILLALCVLIWIIKWFFHRKSPAYVWTPLDFPIIIFFGICAFALLFETPIFKIGVDGIRVTCQYIFWYFVAIQFFKSTANIRKVLYLLITIGFGMAIHGIYQYIFIVPTPTTWVDKAEDVRTRVFSIVTSPNILGSLMVLLIPICISLAIYEKCKYKRVFTSISAILMTLCLVFTSSRGAWICLAFALFIFVFIKDKRLIVPLVIIIALSLLFIPQVSSRIGYLVSSDYVDSSQSGGRLLRWGKGLDMVLDKPLFGVGLGHFGGAVAMNNKIIGTFYMDNYMLKTAVEIGVIGLFSFLVLVYNSLIWSFRALKRLKPSSSINYGIAHGILPGLCGVILHNFFENIFEVPMMVTYYWLLAAMVISLGYIHTANAYDNESLSIVHKQCELS